MPECLSAWASLSRSARTPDPSGGQRVRDTGPREVQGLGILGKGSNGNGNGNGNGMVHLDCLGSWVLGLGSSSLASSFGRALCLMLRSKGTQLSVRLMGVGEREREDERKGR